MLLEIRREFAEGYALRLALSDNSRWFKGRKTTGYQMLTVGYEHKVRSGLTLKVNCGLSYAGSYGGRDRSWSPTWGVQVKGEM